MNTQSFLFENSSKIPEGIYIELMNKLKLDFEKNETTVMIENRSLRKEIETTFSIMMIENRFLRKEIEELKSKVVPEKVKKVKKKK